MLYTQQTPRACAETVWVMRMLSLCRARNWAAGNKIVVGETDWGPAVPGRGENEEKRGDLG